MCPDWTHGVLAVEAVCCKLFSHRNSLLAGKSAGEFSSNGLTIQQLPTFKAA